MHAARASVDVTVPRGVSIHTTVYPCDAPAGGPAVVLLHGITSSGGGWDPVIAPLRERFTPITVDMRGHGASGKPSSGYLYDDYIGDLDRVLTHFGLEHPLIMGHSLGGLVTLWWAARHPDRGAVRAAALVIEDSPLRSGEDFRGAFDGWLALNAMTLEGAMRHYREHNPSWKPDIVRLRAEQITGTARGVIAELKADSMANHGVDRIAEIEHITSPVLLIHGDLATGGMVVPDDAAALTTRLPNAEAVRIPGGSHRLHHESSSAFLAAALPFLDAHAGGASYIDPEALT